jgi:antitoxin component HigA of HigAB toxin-antitoxin module
MTYHVRRITTQEQYKDAIAFLSSLTDDEPQVKLDIANVVADMVSSFEQKILPKRKPPTPGSVLRFLMESNELKQTALVDKSKIPQSTLSDILSDKRSPTVAQAKRLGDLFAVDIGLFLDAETLQVLNAITETRLESIVERLSWSIANKVSRTFKRTRHIRRSKAACVQKRA